MKQKPGRASRESRSRDARESTLASGWTVEGERSADAPDVTGDDHAVVSSDSGSPAPEIAPPDAAAVDSTASRDITEEMPGDALDDVADEAESRAQISNGALVVLGVFGGLYLLYTWGWFIVAQAYSAVNAVTAAGSGVIGGVLQQIVFWAAPMAAPLWFFTALALSRGGKTKRLAILLVVGAVVLLPLPMLIARGA